MTRHVAISFRTTVRLVLVQGLFLAPLHSATPGPTLNFQPYTMRDGLASNLVSALCQDSRGRLWVGTKSGLSMYDGSGFTTYSTSDGLPNDWVTAICERPDKPGALIAGTIAGGVCEYEDGGFRRLTHEGNVNAVHADGSACVWFIMSDTLFMLRHGSLRILAVSSVSPNRGDIIELSDSSGSRQIVAGFGDELLFFSMDGARRLSVPLHDFGDIYAVVGSPSDGTLWLTSAQGKICRVDLAGRVLWTGWLPQREPAALACDRLGRIWVRTVEGLLPIPSDASRFLPGARPFLIEDLRPGGWVGPVMFDREDNLWAGTWARGILKVSDRRIVHDPIDGVTGGSAGLAGDVWITTDSSVIRLSQGKDGSWDRTPFAVKSGFRWEGDPVTDDHGRLWIGGRTQVGAWFVGFRIIRAPGGPVRLAEFARVPIQRSATAWFVDRDDHCWMPVGDTAIEITDVPSGSRAGMLGPRDGLPRAAIKVFYQDHKGDVWIGLWTRGLIRYRAASPEEGGENRIRLFTTRDGLPHEGIRALHEDAGGNMWIGTRYGGLARLDPQGNIKSVSRKTGLRSDVVWKIASDRHGRIWLVTDAGIECIESATLKPLPIQYALAGQNPLAIGIHRGDFFWMATPQGFSTFEFNRPRLSPPPPLVHIASVLVNSRPRSPGELTDLAHDENHCTIGFAGLGFADERNMRYRYRLIGLDNAWSGPVSQRAITYAALNPGEYTFEVVAISSDGLESIEPAEARLRIASPYYRQWWFIVASTVLLGLALWRAYRYRVGRLLELERLRTRIAGDLHDEVGTNLSGILVSTQILERRLNAVLPDADKEHIHEIGVVARSTQEMMRDIVWMLNPSHDRFGDLVLKMKDVASGLLGERDCEFTVSPQDSPDILSIDFKRNVFLIYKEALNNIVRHSSATRIVVEIIRRNGSFVLKVADNGKGFDTGPGRSGSGLTSMRRRAAQLGGSLIVRSASGEGTTVILDVKNGARA